MRSRWNDADAADLTGLDVLVYASRLIGAETSLVVWGGGNTSIKTVERDHRGREIPVLRVKGSGSDLKSIQRKDFPGVRMEDIRALLEREDMADQEMVDYLARALQEPGGPRPSIETLLHGFMPAYAVVHTHADVIVSLTNNDRSREALDGVYGKDLVGLAYRRPGFRISRDVAEAMAAGLPVVCSRGSALEEVAALERVAIEANGNNLILLLPPDCGSITSDRRRIAQILINLLSNAAKFTHKGEIAVTIVRDEDNSLRVSVADTGVGIAPAQKAQLFEAFSAIGGTEARKAGGHGLGLYITAGLVDRLGGSISVESELGKGTRMIVWLPDLQQWADIITQLLKPAGRIVIDESHPIAGCMEVQNGQVRFVEDYFGRKPEMYVGWSHFSGAENAAEKKYEFMWPLGDIVTALAQAGLRIELLEERPSEARWRFGDKLKEAARIPGEYLLMARKDRDTE